MNTMNGYAKNILSDSYVLTAAGGHKALKIGVNTISNLGWTSKTVDDEIIPTITTLAYWNGAYTGTTSNLQYCAKGKFGDIITKNMATLEIPDNQVIWGTAGLSGKTGPVAASLCDPLRGNRFACIKAEAVNIEYSTDAGVTWVDYEATEALKRNLFTQSSASLVLGKNTDKTTDNDNYRLRITVDSNIGSVYTGLSKAILYVSTSGSTESKVTVLVSNDNTTYTDMGTYSLGGWSGYNEIPLGFTADPQARGTNKYYRYIRFLFSAKYKSLTGNNFGLTIINIEVFGGVGWGVPNSFISKYGRPYTYDYDGHSKFCGSIFPDSNNTLTLGTSTKKWKGVYATNFYGNLTGLASNVSCSKDTTTDKARPIVVTNESNLLFYTTKATVNYSTGNITAPTFTGTATKVACNVASSNNDRPIVGTNKSNELYYTTKATVNWETGNITAPTFTGNLIGDADTLDGVHADGLLTALTSTSTNKLSLTVGGTTKTLTTLYASYLTSIGTVNPQTGRTLNYGHVYSYNTAGTAHEGAPTTYTSVIGFGRGTGGTVEIAGGWTSSMGLWYRALRDYEDDWYDWVKVLDSTNSSVSGGGSTWGSSITVKINGTSKTLTIPSNPNTDAKVKQSASTTTNFRPIVLGYNNSTDSTTLDDTETTNLVYVTLNLYANPNAGDLYANKFCGKINVLTCKGTTNTDLWSEIKTSNSLYRGTLNIYDVYDNEGPTTYGNVIEIVSAQNNHWQPLLWFDSNKTGSLRHRNKNYNDDTWGDWKIVLDSNNYTTYVNTTNFPGLNKTGTVTSITLTQGDGITISNSGTAITSSGTRTISNSGVRSTTINGDSLRVNTNGTNADLTIPYATTTKKFKRVFTPSSTSHADLNTCLSGGGIVYNYGSTDYWENGPSGMSYGHVLQLSSGTADQLSGLLAWDVHHNDEADTTNKLWWRATDDGTWDDAIWHKIAFDTDLSNIAYGTCSTAAGTAAKTITLSSTSFWELKIGSIVVIKFTNTNTANNPTFNINNTGAKSIWYNTAVITSSNKDKAGTANRPSIYMYDGTNFVFLGWSYDTNSTYANYSLGQGYGTCSTAVATTEKAVTLSNYNLSTGGIVSVKFTYDVQANATMNINSKGAKAIRYRDIAITTGIIHAGDTATFIYDGTYYRLISVDKGNASLNVYGYMSASDKLKLDAIAENASNVSISRSLTSGTKIGTITINGTGTDLYCLTNTNTTYTLSGALSGNTFISTLTPSSGSATTSTVPAMTAATASAAGKAGLVPAPAANKHTSFLRGDGTWVVPTNTTYTFASGTNGFTVTPSGGTALTVTVTPSITSTSTNPTTYTNYRIPFHTDSNTIDFLRNNGLIYQTQEGTASKEGASVLILGNATATGTAGNKRGALRLYTSTSSVYADLWSRNTSNISTYLPTETSYLVFKSADANNIGSTTKPVYVTASGKITVCSYSVGKVNATASTTSTNKYLLGVTGSGDLITYYHTDGYINANGVFWTSDRKFKKNIQSPVKSGLLEDETGFIRKFDWKETGKPSYGYIAQELLQQIPEAVDYDDKLNKYSVNYNVAHSAAIAQLVIKVKELESEIIRLKLLIN